MDIRILEYYLMVAREESITKAAGLLHVTQPTLSRQLMQLEQELGVKLFTRTNHSIILTEEGRMLKRRAQEIVSLASKTKRDLNSGMTELSGEIAIGCGEFQGVEMLVEIMNKFRRENPLVTFQIFSGNSGIIKERIEAGLLDFGLIFDYVDISKYEYIRMPISEEWGVLVSEKSELASKEYVTPEDIRELPLIISERSLVDHDLADWIEKGYEELNIISTYNLIYNAAMMVAGDMGVAGCIKLNCKYKGVKFIPAMPKVENKAILAWKKTMAKSKAVDGFLQFAQIYINDITANSI